MSKKRILILGGQGFIGFNLQKALAKNPGYEVHVSYPRFSKDRVVDGVIRWPCDLTDSILVGLLFGKVKPDIVLQYAAYTTNSKDVIESPYSHATQNYVINSLVLEAAHRHGVEHFIYPSCATMYESSPLPKVETDWSLDTIPKCYQHVAYMKTAVERMCQAYAAMGKCKYTVIRQSNVFGPGDKTDLDKCHLFMAMVNKIVNAKDSIEVWGDPINQARRDLIYVDDVVDLVSKAIDKQETPFEIFNCGSGLARSVSEIIANISVALDKKLTLNYNTSKPNIPTCTVLSVRKADEVLGWYPKTQFLEGVRKTLEWYGSTK